MSSERAEVLVSIVTWNSAETLENCLASIRSQSISAVVKVFDNHSCDQSVEVARKFGIQSQISSSNVGFSKGHNVNLAAESFQYALILNPDTVLEPDFLELLISRLDRAERVGMAGGKLYRMDSEGEIAKHQTQPLLDSTGIYFTPSFRHFDRGSELPDDGRFDHPQYVFGITGAAMMISQDFYRDIHSVGNEFFDEDFFAFREDADLCWRAQLRGWRCVYEPRAIGRHRRTVLPERRREVSREINRHSVKNRFLMRIKNLDWRVRVRCFPNMYLRDLAIVAYILGFERSSLQAFTAVHRLRKKMLKKRSAIQATRRITPREMASWFSYHPTALNVNG